ncbi:MAG: glycoside hydrolase family 15 protein, partial [Patescibacteria group bacterium]
GHAHRMGLWIDGVFCWCERGPDWRFDYGYEHETLVGAITARNDRLGVEILFNDCVYNEKDIFLRKCTVRNLRLERRKARMFFHQEFQIAESGLGNTVYYDPRDKFVVHYKGRRVFLINGRVGEEGIADYATGACHFAGTEGTWRDAEDGELSKNAVQHGSVDATVAFHFVLDGDDFETVYYWVAGGTSVVEAQDLNRYVLMKKPAHLMETTKDYWRAWVNKRNFSFYGLSPDLVDLFKKSLLIVKTHVDNKGAIIASADSDMLSHGRDTYSYMWPRDGAFVALALDKSGYFESTHQFFDFCNEVIMPEGYMMHKYLCDRSLGSSWHPWVGEEGHAHLPIQEDETALVLFALWNHYDKKRDLEFVESIYNSFIKKAADFLVGYRHDATGLPRPSYDLWEEHRGIFTFTCSAVYGGLTAAAQFAKLLGKTREAHRYSQAAEEVKAGILEHLWNAEKGYFYKRVRWSDSGEKKTDAVVDASAAYAIFRFGVLPPDDPKVESAMKIMKERLAWQSGIGGFARYEGDKYYRVSDAGPGNPWIICTLWYADWLIAKAKKEADFKEIIDVLRWVRARAGDSGILSEQFHPETGEPKSVAPLTWSHAAYVLTVIEYLERLEELGICEACLPI